MQKLLFIAGMLLMCAPVTAIACDCVTLSTEERYERADRVFVGEAIRQEESGAITTFRIVKTLKGTDTAEVSINSDRSDCDAWFAVGFVYLVFARGSQDKLFASSCSNPTALGISTAADVANRTAVSSPTPFLSRAVAAILGGSAVLCFLIWFVPTRTLRREA